MDLHRNDDCVLCENFVRDIESNYTAVVNTAWGEFSIVDVYGDWIFLLKSVNDCSFSKTTNSAPGVQQSDVFIYLFFSNTTCTRASYCKKKKNEELYNNTNNTGFLRIRAGVD